MDENSQESASGTTVEDAVLVRELEMAELRQQGVWYAVLVLQRDFTLVRLWSGLPFASGKPWPCSWCAGYGAPA